MLIERIRMLLVAATGMELDRKGVGKAMRARMQAMGEADVARYASRVQQGSTELDALIDELVVPETWFFRQPEAFAAACAIVDCKRNAARPVRILSLPCASGEEPYSIAIALLERGFAARDFSIEGMDISVQALQRARAACYQRNAFRGCDAGFRARWFEQRGESWQLRPEVRQQVRFARANLLEIGHLAPPDRYDIVFCRNLLIYFDAPTQAEAIGQLERLLHPKGVLFSGYAEAPAFCRAGFALAPYPGAFALVRSCVPALPPHGDRKLTPFPAPSPAPFRASPLRRSSLPPAGAVGAIVQTVGSARPAGQPGPEQDSLLAQARRLADAGELVLAEQLYLRHLEQAPESAEAYFMLGVLYERMGRLSNAADALRRAVYLEPTHYEALCHMALLQERRGESGLASSLRERAARVYRRLQEWPHERQEPR